MILVRLLNLRFLTEYAAMNDRNLKFAALVGWPQSPPAQKREAPSGGADDASETGHRGGGRSRVADTMLKARVGSWLYGISFLSKPERLQGSRYLPGCRVAPWWCFLGWCFLGGLRGGGLLGVSR